jgi:hypothetical protein
VSADYLLWWMRRRSLPTLATTGSINDAIPGALGQPGTAPITSLDPSGQFSASGGRITFAWLDATESFGMSGSVFYLTQTASRQISGTGTNPNLTISRPFFDPNFNIANADPVVVPLIQAGTLSVRMPQHVYGADLNLRYETGGREANYHLTPLLGARFLALDQQLLIREAVIDLPDANGNVGTATALQDNFSTYNRFYGGQVGLEAEKRIGAATLSLTGKVAFGVTSQVLKISGITTVQGPDVGVVTDPTRGLLVQPSNLGRVSRTAFGVVPELDFTFGWDVTEFLRLEVGYMGLYWNKVVQPSDQIDTTVNVGVVGFPGQVGTSQRPQAPFQTSSFWANGLHAGVRFFF